MLKSGRIQWKYIVWFEWIQRYNLGEHCVCRSSNCSYNLQNCAKKKKKNTPTLAENRTSSLWSCVLVSSVGFRSISLAVMCLSFDPHEHLEFSKQKMNFLQFMWKSFWPLNCLHEFLVNLFLMFKRTLWCFFVFCWVNNITFVIFILEDKVVSKDYK